MYQSINDTHLHTDINKHTHTDAKDARFRENWMLVMYITLFTHLSVHLSVHLSISSMFIIYWQKTCLLKKHWFLLTHFSSLPFDSLHSNSVFILKSCVDCYLFFLSPNRLSSYYLLTLHWLCWQYNDSYYHCCIDMHQELYLSCSASFWKMPVQFPDEFKNWMCLKLNLQWFLWIIFSPPEFLSHQKWCLSSLFTGSESVFSLPFYPACTEN